MSPPSSTTPDSFALSPDTSTQLDAAQRWRLITDLLGHCLVAHDPQLVRLIVVWMQTHINASDASLLAAWESLPDEYKTPRNLHV